MARPKTDDDATRKPQACGRDSAGKARHENRALEAVRSLPELLDDGACEQLADRLVSLRRFRFQCRQPCNWPRGAYLLGRNRLWSDKEWLLRVSGFVVQPFSPFWRS
jgi:hypothetical protein